MTDSKQWALEKMAEANKIFEPNEVKPGIQLAEIILWTIEIVLVILIVSRFF